MAPYIDRVREVYDRTWDSAETAFENYPRNQLLKRWLQREMHNRGRLLDVACGDGSTCEYFANAGYDVTGFDISATGIERAAERGKGVFCRGNVEERFPFRDQSFDVVFWGDNVEHLLQPMITLGEIHRVLKPNGKLLISCPNMGYWKFRLIYLLRGAPPRTEGQVNPPWEWEHLRLFTPNILTDFLAAGGFTVLHLEGVLESRTTFLARSIPQWFASIVLAEARRN